MLESISTYLKNESYRISIIESGLHVLNYTSIVDITSEEAILKINKKLIKIYGKNLTLIRLDKKELLINGIIKKVIVDEY